MFDKQTNAQENGTFYGGKKCLPYGNTKLPFLKVFQYLIASANSEVQLGKLNSVTKQNMNKLEHFAICLQEENNNIIYK